MSDKKISRRNFLQKAAIIGGAAVIIPSIPIYGNGKRIAGPKVVGSNEKVNLALIGIGNRGNEDAKAFMKTGLCNIVALCDTDMGARHTQEIISMCPGVPQFRDFREMFAKMASRIDAVMIATPDHSHFPIAMAAMREGIHVYVEKPLARTFHECELLMAAADKYGVVTQMGNQGHSQANYFQFKAWKEAGIIRNVTAVTAHMNNSRRWHKWNPDIASYPAAEPVPDTLDWDTWLCGIHEHPYNHDYINGQWRCWYDMGMGALGDWGAHILDTVHEFLELGLPTEVNPIYLKGHNRFFYPMSSTIKFHFPERKDMPPLDITWYDGLDNVPELPAGYGVSELDPDIPSVAGTKIQARDVNPGKEIYSENLTFKGGSHGSILSIIPEEKAQEWNGKLPEIPESPSDHFENFLLSVTGREKTRSPFSVSGPLSQVFCLGVISQWTGERIIFDRETKQITNNPLANQLLWGAVPREEWSEYYHL